MNIFRRRFKESRIELEPARDLQIKLECKAKIFVRKTDGSVIESGWFHNLITNNGLDTACQGAGLYTFLNDAGSCYCHLGSGTTAPANADVKLGTWVQSVAASTGAVSGTSTTNDTTNGACSITAVFNFAAAASAYTINEVGLGTSSNTTGLRTHAAVSPGIPVASGQVVTVAYTFTESIPALITPVTVSMSAVNGFNVSGQLKVCGTYAVLFGNLSSGVAWTVPTSYRQLHCSATATGALLSAPTTFPAVNTALTETVLGTGNAVNYGTYTAGSFVQTANFVWTPSQPASTVANVNMIRLLVGTAGHGVYLLLNSAQTKANTNTLTITVQLSVARA